MKGELKIETVSIETVKPHPRNVRQGDLGAISQSLNAHGQYRAIVVQRSTGNIIAGNHTWKAAKALGWKQIAVQWLDIDDEQALRILLADNKSSDLAAYDDSQLAELLREIAATSAGLAGTLYDGDDLDQIIHDINAEAADGMADSLSTGNIIARFGIAPFSLLDCRRGWWRERRKRWLNLGILSEVGRDGNLLQMSDMILGRRGSEVLGAEGRAENLLLPNSAIYRNRNPDTPQYTGTSVFDPVLCEIAYRWFAPAGGLILDPFAGGSVRGIVASQLGMHYRGIELRPEQVKANREQLATIGAGSGSAEWTKGDSAEVLRTMNAEEQAEEFDLLFSCPPYHTLEIYSDLPGDLSNIEDYDDFYEIYGQIIIAASARLKQDRFAVWVISEIRDGDGNYRNFVGDTIRAFGQAGLSYYNEAIYIQQAGSWPLRIGRVFGGSRKIARLHQNVLVFAKGDPFAAAAEFGEPEWGFDNEPQMLAEEQT
jgi:DNA modification methylase